MEVPFDDDQCDRMVLFGAGIVAKVVSQDQRLRSSVSLGPGSQAKRFQPETSTMLAKSVQSNFRWDVSVTVVHAPHGATLYCVQTHASS